jgi:hypothetical protein
MKALSARSLILAATVGCNAAADHPTLAPADSGRSPSMSATATAEVHVDAAVPDASEACNGRNPNCLVGGCDSELSCSIPPSSCVDSTFVCNGGVWQSARQDCRGRVCLAEPPNYFVRVGIVQGQAPVAALTGFKHLSLSRYIGLMKKPDRLAFSDISGSCSDPNSFLGPGIQVNSKYTTFVEMPMSTDARVAWMIADSPSATPDMGIRVVNATLDGQPFPADLLYAGGARKSLGEVAFGKANAQGYVREGVLSELQIIGKGGSARTLRLPLADRTGTYTVYVTGHLAGATTTALICKDSEVQPTGADGLYSDCTQTPLTEL